MMKYKRIPFRNRRQQLASLAIRACDDPDGFRVDFLRNEDWVACPFELGPLIDPDLASAIVPFFSHNCIIAIELHASILHGNLHGKRRLPECFVVPCEPKLIHTWSVKMSWGHWLLTSDVVEGAILCSMENYNVVAGPRDRVEKLLGMSVYEAYRSFLLFIERSAGSDFPYAKEDAVFLRSQIERYTHQFAKEKGQELKAKLEVNSSKEASSSAGGRLIREVNVSKDESLRAEAEGERRAEDDAAEAEHRAAMRSSTLEIDCGGRVMLKLALVPAGEFLMGSGAEAPDADDDEKPQHRVTITKPFYMGIYPVTQAQYRAVTGESPSHFKGDLNPVENVSWFDAQKFCELLSARVGREVRLPTEAEWEYACRAGTATSFSFGDDDSVAHRYAWFEDNSEDRTHPVGQKLPNGWGLFDMHGNVWEWCSDWYSDSYVNAGATDPPGPASGSARVLRGGCWYNLSPWNFRSASRFWSVPENCIDGIGFRVVVESD